MTVREEAQWCIQQDGMLAEIRKKIRSGKATYEDTAAYSARAGKMIGALFSRRLPEIPPEEREQLCVELLHDQYIDINAAVDAAQRYLDERLGIQLAPQHAPFDSERGHQIGSSLRDLSKPVETLQRRAKAATETATKAIHDDRMESEAKFRSRAGLKCFITRKAVSGCCAWCTALAGRYAYGEEPDDIYRRHDNCDCTVTFENGRKRQDVWSKREWEAPEPGAGAGDPVVLTAEQAAALQAEHGLTKPSESGTIKLMKSVQVPGDFVYINGTKNNFEKFEDSDLSIEVLRAIESTISKRHDETADFRFDSILVAKFDSAHEKSVFITDLVERGSELKTTLYINKDFVIGKTKEQIDSMCIALKESGWWQSGCLEDLIDHEIVHARLGYINGAYKADQMYEMLLEDERVNGFCHLVDRDRSEFMNEMTVAIKRGESIKKEYLDIYEEYAKDYLGGATHG